MALTRKAKRKAGQGCAFLFYFLRRAHSLMSNTGHGLGHFGTAFVGKVWFAWIAISSLFSFVPVKCLLGESPSG